MVEIASRVTLAKQLRNVGRLAQITNVFARHGLFSLLESIGIKQWLSPEQIRIAKGLSSQKGPQASHDEITQNPVVHGVPARLRRAFEELGPAFVKLGQVLATREDLIGSEFILELKNLHRSVQAIPYKDIQAVLKEELGSDKLGDFEHIDHKPLAAGSMAQVHRARLKGGVEVVLKVQRPGIKQLIETDLNLMELIAGLGEKYISDARSLRPTLVIDEFARATRGELDFIREGGTMSKIAANFAEVQDVAIPEVFWDYSTSRVLVQSYLEGVSIDESPQLQAQGIDVVSVVEKGLEAFMKMVFVDGFYHGDLHPGNVLILKDGRIGILDFGVGVLISRQSRERLAALLMSLVQEDYESMVTHFLELSHPSADFDVEAFTHEVSNALAPFVGLTLSSIKSGHLLWQLASIAGRYGAPLPRELILFMRTLIAFEGIGAKLDPDFDVIKACETFATKLVGQMYSVESMRKQALLVARDFAQLGRYAPRQLRSILRSIIDGNLTFRFNSEDILSLSQSLDRASMRLSISLLAAALAVSSSVLIFAQAGRDFYSFSIVGLIQLGVAAVLASTVVLSIFRPKK